MCYAMFAVWDMLFVNAPPKVIERATLIPSGILSILKGISVKYSDKICCPVSQLPFSMFEPRTNAPKPNAVTCRLIYGTNQLVNVALSHF